MRSTEKASLRKTFSLFDVDEELELNSAMKSNFNMTHFAVDSLYSCSNEAVQTTHNKLEISADEDSIGSSCDYYSDDLHFSSSDLSCESTVLIENAEAIECFLPNISGDQDEIEQFYLSQERSEEEDDDDEDSSWASPVPAEPPIHDPRFQQAIDEFTFEKASFDKNLDNFSASSFECNSKISLLKRSLTFPATRYPPRSSPRTPGRIQSLTSKSFANVPLVHSESFTVECEILPCKDTKIVPLSSYYKKQVVFKMEDNDVVETEILGPLLRPASEMSDCEKERLWWKRSDYRDFRDSFSFDLTRGCETGFMCSG